MIFDIISEIASWFVAGLVDSTARGLVVTTTLLSLSFGGVAAWLLLASPDPLNEPVWGGEVLVAYIFAGTAALCLSVLHLVRDERDRWLSAICVALNLCPIRGADCLCFLFWK